jgi:ABC-type dipeptide/oligopeptide/nickel transport system permease component
MTSFIVRRILSMFLVLLVVSGMTFFFMKLIPGNPFDGEKNIPPGVIAQLEAKYNLDDPPVVQYINYMEDLLIPRLTPSRIEPGPGGIVQDYLVNIPIPGTDTVLRAMNFGPSYRSASRSVNDIFRDHLPVSFELGVAAFLVASIVGIPAGVAAGLRRNTWVDYTSMAVALIGVSIPAIVSGPVIQYIFGVELQWVPPTGWGTPAQVVLPALALGLASSALLARLTRASLLQVLNEDYIRTARSKGLSERRVIILHALKNSMIPVITVMGPMFAALITGTFVVEEVFGIPGLGEYFITAIGNRDYPVIMGTTLLWGTFLVIANLIVDILYGVLDPRITY